MTPSQTTRACAAVMPLATPAARARADAAMTTLWAARPSVIATGASRTSGRVRTRAAIASSGTHAHATRVIAHHPTPPTAAVIATLAVVGVPSLHFRR